MPKSGNGAAKAPLILSPKDIQILRLVAKARFVSAEQVAEALYTRGQLTTARGALRRLSGGADHTPRFPLYRFSCPSASPGNPQRVYTLSNRGRDILVREFGVPVAPWYIRPYKTQLTFGYLRHALALTALYVCAWQWNKGQSAVRLKECRLSYELCRLPTLPVVPDAHLVFEGQAGRWAIWLEVDGSSQGQAVWKKRLTERLTFIRSGGYKRTFGAARLRVCYVVVGQSAQAADTRRQTLCKWAVEAVKSLGLQESFAELFRFMSLDLDAVYELGLFQKPVWYRPDAPTTPVPLLQA